MGTIFLKELKIQRPDLIACWPGIGNIGLIAIEAMREQLEAEEFAEIEPWDFYYPTKVTIRGGILDTLEFPTNKFYYKRLPDKDYIFFIGEEQPAEEGRAYAEGRKAYEMASAVLDVAGKYDCRRVYTSGAAVSTSHHSRRPRVWAVTSSEALNKEVKTFSNTVLMGEVEGRGERGGITGLNGLLLGLAKKRGLEAICLMGEIPDYLSTMPFPYPRASKSVLEIFARILHTELDFSMLDEMIVHMDGVIEGVYEKFPPEVKESVDLRKSALDAQEKITEDEEKWMKAHIEELFKKGGKGDERPS